jgi:hypothetical protein
MTQPYLNRLSVLEDGGQGEKQPTSPEYSQDTIFTSGRCTPLFLSYLSVLEPGGASHAFILK